MPGKKKTVPPSASASSPAGATRLYRTLERKLGYTFGSRELLCAALTHPSFRYESTDTCEDNQRMEFLGDAVLGFLAAEHFYRMRAGGEGELTVARSAMVNTRSLAQVAIALKLGPLLRLGRGEEQTGGRTRASNLCDSMEALIGAAFLDGGMDAARKVFERVLKWAPVMDDGGENPKGLLQARCQRRWKIGPQYILTAEEGPPHARVFHVEVHVGGQLYGKGQGGSKRAAEIAAARKALKKIKE